MNEFETGKSYICRSVCDHDCVWTFTVAKRTTSSIWILVDGEMVRRSVTVYDGNEIAYPFGKFSMAPIIRAIAV